MTLHFLKILFSSRFFKVPIALENHLDEIKYVRNDAVTLGALKQLFGVDISQLELCDLKRSQSGIIEIKEIFETIFPHESIHKFINLDNISDGKVYVAKVVNEHYQKCQEIDLNMEIFQKSLLCSYGIYQPDPEGFFNNNKQVSLERI